MFTQCIDEDACEVIWLFTGKTNSDDDFARYVASIEELIPLPAARGGFVVNRLPALLVAARAQATSHADGT